MRYLLRALPRAITISLMGIAPATQAASNSANFDVGIQVNATCGISASNMTFSSITTGTTSNTDATSALTVNCSNGTPYTISLGNGNNYSAGRRMASGASFINYYLYSDSSRSTQWNTTATKSGTGSGNDQSLTIYGRVPSGQSVTNTGAYADTIVATITY
jgi:spore coat protein U-like protein